MSIGGYKIREQSLPHFVTFAVVEWVDVFTRREYRDLVLDSLRFMQEHKGLIVHAWCMMSNHVHLVAKAREENLSEIFCGTSKNSLPNSSLLPFSVMKKKAAVSGWLIYLAGQARATPVIQLISSGGMIISPKNCIACSLPRKRLITFITILLRRVG